MNISNTRTQAYRGFTLIELLVVISIIAILAALLLPAGAKIQQNAAKALVRTELMKVDLAINAYKSKLGFFPPDNPNATAANPLYFELVGCRVTNNGTLFITLDGASSASSAQLSAQFGVSGIANASTGSGSDDAGSTVQQFLKDIRPGQFGQRTVGTDFIRVLGVKVDGPLSWPLPSVLGDVAINPFRYNSSNPTNNVNSFDLWVDVKIGGKTNRISNWSTQPQIIP